jgi:hypothetical protein
MSESKSESAVQRCEIPGFGREISITDLFIELSMSIWTNETGAFEYFFVRVIES